MPFGARRLRTACLRPSEMARPPHPEIRGRTGQAAGRLTAPGAQAGAATAGAATASSAASAEGLTLQGFFGVFRYSRRAVELVWSTSPTLTVRLALLTLIAGVLPAAVAYVGSLIVDAVVMAHAWRGASLRASSSSSCLEGALVAIAAAAPTRHFAVPVAAARATRPARQRHDPREGADARSAALRGLGVLRQAHARAARGLEPAAESRDAHLRAGAERRSRSSVTARCWRISRPGPCWCCCWRDCRRSSPRRSSPEMPFGCFAGARPKRACRSIWRPCIGREDYAKEVKLYGLGPRLLGALPRYLSPALQGGSRAHHPPRRVGLRARAARRPSPCTRPMPGSRSARCAAVITLGQMTMYLALFRQGQAAVSAMLSAVGGMYEDNLYLSTLYEYLETPVADHSGGVIHGPDAAGWHPLRGCWVPLSGSRAAGARGYRPASAAGAESRAGGRERLG